MLPAAGSGVALAAASAVKPNRSGAIHWRGRGCGLGPRRSFWQTAATPNVRRIHWLKQREPMPITLLTLRIHVIVGTRPALRYSSSEHALDLTRDAHTVLCS